MFGNGTLGIVGSGRMAEAMISGVLEKGLLPAQIIASGPKQKRADELIKAYGIQATTDNRVAADTDVLVVLSTKPQTMRIVLNELHGHIHKDAVVVSIAAGVRLETLYSGLDHRTVVRAMPNTPGRINMGFTMWTCTAEVTPEQRAKVAELLGALGKQRFVEEEKYLDMTTATSGTGPALVFMFMEAMIDASVHIGMPRALAEETVIETMLGSVLLAKGEITKKDGRHLAQLRSEVTSPAGTTAAAIYALEKATFRTAVVDALHAAHMRCIELGKLLGGN
ncbi:pyrroline-5-carboxylate reductase [Candidatus Uhrbacteria bacterium]|nr:pyrroline-5-carboxylate reductase [Candidatus Uhrbacteria bacterium]